MRNLAKVILCYIFILLMLIVFIQNTHAGEITTCRICASSSASDNIAVSTMEGERFTITTFYINPLHSSQLGPVSYITFVILDNKTGKVTITKVPEKEFTGGRAYTFLPRSGP